MFWCFDDSEYGVGYGEGVGLVVVGDVLVVFVYGEGEFNYVV